jgi:hypothetical protein
MTWGTGLPKAPPLSLMHSDVGGKVWQKIYIHVLGHMLGLEHPGEKAMVIGQLIHPTSTKKMQLWDGTCSTGVVKFMLGIPPPI